MPSTSGSHPSRREFLKTTGQLAAASAMALGAVPHVHAGESHTIRLALVGCGGRGTGAVADALGASQGPVKLVALADVFPSRLKASAEQLKRHLGDKADVPEDRRFLGFDAYRQTIDCLGPGDVVIFATPPAFRWVHFSYAVEKGVNVFMEKPVTVDGPSTRRMLKLGAASVKKNLKVGVGLMCRHCDARKQLHDRIRSGQLGEIIAMRTYRMHAPIASFASDPRPAGIGELLYQVRRFHSFLWASGGCYSDFYIHNIDECCWMKDAWPLQAQGIGGRHYRGSSIDQNLDNYHVEYTFPDGTKLFLAGRCMSGCFEHFASYAHGSKGLGVISTSGHSPAKCRIYKGHNLADADLVWRGPKPEPSPYHLEWEHLLAAIRQDQPYNEVQRGAEASLVAAMGRMACHTGQIVTFDQALNHEHELGPGLDRLTLDSAAPLMAGPDGKYSVPQPGMVTNREY